MTVTKPLYGSAIPDISDERLAELVARIRPVSEPDRREVVRFYAPSDPRREAFKWRSEDLTAEEATIVAYISNPFRTLHTFSAPSFFRPTLEEVFAQIPADIDLTRANAFWIEFKDFETVRPEGGQIGSGQTYQVGLVHLYWVR
jgi:hypothetical protein